MRGDNACIPVWKGDRLSREKKIYDLGLLIAVLFAGSLLTAPPENRDHSNRHARRGPGEKSISLFGLENVIRD